MNWYTKTKISSDLYDELKHYGPEGEGHLESGETPEQIEKDNFVTNFLRRDKFVEQYGWSVPTKEAINKLKAFIGNDKVLEIGSGNALWAKLLQDIGVSIVATDIAVRKQPFTDVERLDYEQALQAYPDNQVLMLSWPPYDDPMAAGALKNFKGSKLIYIGEGTEGCTADSEFCHILYTYWREIGDIDIPRWIGINDYITLLVRK